MRKDEFPIVKEYCREKIVKELEEIKAEMEEIKSGCIGGIDYFDIIDDHISELKGENK